MTRVMASFVIVFTILWGEVACGEVEASKKTAWPFIWRAPDTLWAVGGFGQLRPGLLDEIIRRKPDGFDGIKQYELEHAEPGEWWGFAVGLKKVKRVVLTKSTKFVLTTKNGKKVESEAITFCTDKWQTVLYDNRRSPIIVSTTTVWRNASGDPAGWVKFPKGSIRREDVASFEVVGAVVDTTQTATK